MKKIALIATSFVLLATPALTQSTTNTDIMSATVGAAPPDVKYSTLSPNEMFSSKLKGLNVYNSTNESIGEISDVAISANNQVDALILSVGGFLGVGEHYVAVSPSSVAVRYDNDKASWRATMNATRDDLKKAPEFKYPKR